MDENPRDKCKFKGFTTRCKLLVTLKNRKSRLDFERKHLKKPGIRFFGHLKPK